MQLLSIMDTSHHLYHQLALTFILQDDVSEDGRLPIGDLQKFVEVFVPALVQGLWIDAIHCF